MRSTFKEEFSRIHMDKKIRCFLDQHQAPDLADLRSSQAQWGTVK